ncbi:uncharacterized protein B0I36DRAFT_134898 [Microdochium trichocladiopsis]|uniref:Uncharacterized protein n=1 Tax=Microdochium trichocladiopsis TaxID=1682393 RepID=A0A9P8Y7A4_9PEZI|nr:uncharacterized protein B0I36DRAFT_134898 [Microdochium trichocladiopsis]KAH7029698.1 hypothetical protein B0I36DRAFT_134898 [Microdochium trichocladiopsis]
MASLDSAAPGYYTAVTGPEHDKQLAALTDHLQRSDANSKDRAPSGLDLHLALLSFHLDQQLVQFIDNIKTVLLACGNHENRLAVWLSAWELLSNRSLILDPQDTASIERLVHAALQVKPSTAVQGLVTTTFKAGKRSPDRLNTLDQVMASVGNGGQQLHETGARSTESLPDRSPVPNRATPNASSRNQSHESAPHISESQQNPSSKRHRTATVIGDGLAPHTPEIQQDPSSKRRRTTTNVGERPADVGVNLSIGAPHASPVPINDSSQLGYYIGVERLPAVFPRLLCSSIHQEGLLARVSARYPPNAKDCGLKMEITPTQVTVIVKELFGVTLGTNERGRYILDVDSGVRTEIMGSLLFTNPSLGNIREIFGPRVITAFTFSYRFGSYEDTGDPFRCLTMEVSGEAGSRGLLNIVLNPGHLEMLANDLIM